MRQHLLFSSVVNVDYKEIYIKKGINLGDILFWLIGKVVLFWPFMWRRS